MSFLSTQITNILFFFSFFDICHFLCFNFDSFFSNFRELLSCYIMRANLKIKIESSAERNLSWKLIKIWNESWSKFEQKIERDLRRKLIKIWTENWTKFETKVESKFEQKTERNLKQKLIKIWAKNWTKFETRVD